MTGRGTRGDFVIAGGRRTSQRSLGMPAAGTRGPTTGDGSATVDLEAQ